MCVFGAYFTNNFIIILLELYFGVKLYLIGENEINFRLVGLVQTDEFDELVHGCDACRLLFILPVFYTSLKK